MANPNRRGPRALCEILGELFTVRGYGRLQASGELEQAWNCAVGEPYCHETRVGELRRGILSVTVAHPTLLEELAAFRKAEILEALRTSAPGMTIEDIRFRIGPVGQGRPEAGTAHSVGSEQATQMRPQSADTKRQVKGRRTRLGQQSRGKAGDGETKSSS
jgi:hypothetical protein